MKDLVLPRLLQIMSSTGTVRIRVHVIMGLNAMFETFDKSACFQLSQSGETENPSSGSMSPIFRIPMKRRALIKTFLINVDCSDPRGNLRSASSAQTSAQNRGEGIAEIIHLQK